MNIPKTIKKTGLLLKETFKEFIADNCIKLSAALSYYTIFSLPPLLLIIISLCGIFFGDVAVNGEIFKQINGLVGNDAAKQIQEIIKNVRLSDSNVFVTTVGAIILIIGASGVFVEIQDSINYIWGIKSKPKRGLIKFIKNRIMSFSMIGSVGFLLLVGLIVNSLMEVLNKKLLAYFPNDTFYLLYFFNILSMFFTITILFTIIFKALPDGKVVIKDCLIGACFTAFLFMIGKFGIGAYLSSTSIATTYGAAGSIILILIWVYYSAIILYFGAVFTKVYATNHGHKIIPNDYSVLIIEQNIEIETKSVLINSNYVE